MCKIRKAYINDVEELFRLWQLLSQDHFQKQGINYETSASNFYKDLVDNEECIILLAENEDGGVIAYSETYIREPDEVYSLKKYAYVLHTYVLPEYRSTRALFDMLDELINILKRKEIYYLCADVYSSNRRFHNNIQILGFKPYMTRFINKIDEDL